MRAASARAQTLSSLLALSSLSALGQSDSQDDHGDDDGGDDVVLRFPARLCTKRKPERVYESERASASEERFLGSTLASPAEQPIDSATPAAVKRTRRPPSCQK